MKRVAGGLGLVLATVGMGSTAFAGETTGNGKPTQGPAHANSICVYSGLNDNPDDPIEGGRTQNWGQIPREERAFLRSIGVSPGTECNAHLNPLRRATPRADKFGFRDPADLAGSQVRRRCDAAAHQREPGCVSVPHLDVAETGLAPASRGGGFAVIASSVATRAWSAEPLRIRRRNKEERDRTAAEVRHRSGVRPWRPGQLACPTLRHQAGCARTA
jgi:hypothetical protein